MADYYEISVRDVDNPDMVGISWHEAPDGTGRFFLGLEGKPINQNLDLEWQRINWSALTTPCAEKLSDALLTMFEIQGHKLPGWKIRRKQRLFWRLRRVWREFKYKFGG